MTRNYVEVLPVWRDTEIQRQNQIREETDRLEHTLDKAWDEGCFTGDGRSFLLTLDAYSILVDIAEDVFSAVESRYIDNTDWRIVEIRWSSGTVQARFSR
jgi:hypothetical protein